MESLQERPIPFTDELSIHPIPYTKPGTELADEEAAAIAESILWDIWARATSRFSSFKIGVTSSGICGA